jgi:formylglycine-generating enzyme required for sulfatase activity
MLRAYAWGVIFLIVTLIFAVMLPETNQANAIRSIFTSTPTPKPIFTPSITSEPSQTALQRARNFIGDNNDWQPFEDDFDGVPMVLVPVGCFNMGNDPEAWYWNGSDFVAGVPEGGQQCFDTPFWIDKYEVTNAQFAQFDGTAANVSRFSGDQHPRESVTWFEARDFCLVRGTRLPTESEWEYAARGLDEWSFAWGEMWDESNAVWSRDASEGTAPVGSIPAGASWVGALDMSGNVWEWVNSLAEPYPYNRDDGREADTGERTDIQRVLRSGSWATYDSAGLRTTSRYIGYPPDVWSDGFGFRCARDI